jgi:hypothetical protein
MAPNPFAYAIGPTAFSISNYFADFQGIFQEFLKNKKEEFLKNKKEEFLKNKKDEFL